MWRQCSYLIFRYNDSVTYFYWNVIYNRINTRDFVSKNIKRLVDRPNLYTGLHNLWTRSHTVTTLHPGLHSTDAVPPWWEFLPNSTLAQVKCSCWSRKKRKKQRENERTKGVTLLRRSSERSTIPELEP